MANLTYEPGDASNSDKGAETLTHRVYLALRDEIVAGSIRPGDRLVRRTLSKRLGVSPMPITEALLKLECDGLVESRQSYGCRVRPLTLDELRSEEALREAVECHAARLSAEHASDSEISQLRVKARIVDRMLARGNPDSQLGMREHLDFHLTVARSGGVNRLAEELGRVWFRRLMRLNWVKGTVINQGPQDWHVQLVDAISTRDPQKAEDMMRRHVKFNEQLDMDALMYLVQHEDAEVPEVKP